MKIIYWALFLFSMVLLGFLIGCGTDKPQQKQESIFEGPGADENENSFNFKVNYIEYLRDKRTNLCFAYFFQYKGPAFTNVPCTEEVMELIKQK